ncbi:MAG TPA: hypothetical protein VFR64_12685 [Methylomirabilota bacterium]|jgi:hypothetical protein|nr:hypothetical protein [Methylomirabilota bacterium]
MLGDLAIWLSAAVGVSASVYIVATATVTFARFLKRRSRAHA